MRGLWVEVLGDDPPLRSCEGLDKLIRYAVDNRITDLFIQVFRGGECWFNYPGSIFCVEDECAEGNSCLQYCLDAARDSSLNVHAWINCLNLGVQVNPSVLTALPVEYLQCDSAGRCISSYADYSSPTNEELLAPFIVDAPGVWLDPGNEQVVTELADLADYLAGSFPDLSGIHLDYIRYPYTVPIRPSSAVSYGIDFGYSEGSRSSFEAQVSGGAPFEWDHKRGFLLSDYESSLCWDRWRRENVTGLIRRIKERLPSTMLLSAAVVAFADRAYLSAFQDWRYWMKEELLDAVCLMSYTGDDMLFQHLIQQAAAFQSTRARLYAGIGSYRLRDAEEHLERQIEIAAATGAAGTIIFSYRNLRHGD